MNERVPRNFTPRLDEEQREICKFIAEHVAKYGYPALSVDIEHKFNRSAASAAYVLAKLERMDYIERLTDWRGVLRGWRSMGMY